MSHLCIKRGALPDTPIKHWRLATLPCDVFGSWLFTPAFLFRFLIAEFDGVLFIAQQSTILNHRQSVTAQPMALPEKKHAQTARWV